MADEKQEVKQEEKPLEKPLENLSALYDKIKIENDRAEAILNRQEELAARGLLGGKSDAGIQPDEPKPIEGAEYLRQIQKGFKGV